MFLGVWHIWVPENLLKLRLLFYSDFQKWQNIWIIVSTVIFMNREISFKKKRQRERELKKIYNFQGNRALN